MLVADPLDDAVEDRRADHLAEREFDVEGREIVLQRDQLLAARRLMDAVHHRRLLPFERLGRGDVGGDHIILDQPMRVEPLARRDRQDAALFVEHHPAFGQVELERLALVAGGEKARQQAQSGFSALSTSSPRHRPFKLGHRAGRGRSSTFSSPAASIAA